MVRPPRRSLLPRRPPPEVPAAPIARDANAEAEGRQLLRACLDAHGGAAAYARLRDVNVRLDGQMVAFLAPKLQPKLADVRFRGGSEDVGICATGRGWIVGQIHTGPGGLKGCLQADGPRTTVWYDSGWLNFEVNKTRESGSEQRP